MFIKQPFSEKRLLICSKVKWGFGNPMASFDQHKQTILIVQDKNNPHKNSFAVSQCGNSSSFHTHQNQCKARNSPRERQQCCDRHFIVFCYFFSLLSKSKVQALRANKFESSYYIEEKQ